MVSGGIEDNRADTNEFFAGKQAWSAAMRAAGMVTNTFELRDDEEQNMLTPGGFCLAVKNILETRAAGLNLFAVVCSSWTFLNRGTSGRDPLRPLDNQGLAYVREANVMVARVVMLIRLAVGCRQACIVENPLSTLVHYHPRFQQLLRDFFVFRVVINLGDFGGATRKPVILRCTEAWINEMKSCDKLKRTERVHTTTVVYHDGSGQKRCKGGPDLKASQEYPPFFGTCMAKLLAASGFHDGQDECCC